MKNIILYTVLNLLASLTIVETGLTQVVYSANLQEHNKITIPKILYKKDILTNQTLEFYKTEAMIGILKVSPDGKKIAFNASYSTGRKTTNYLLTLDIINSDAELIFSLSDLTSYHVMDFCFDPSSNYIAFVAGITHPYTEADYSMLPIGLGILDIENKSVAWIIGGPKHLNGPVLQYCSWPQGGSIYAYGWTNDDNNFIQSVYGVDPITHELLKSKSQQANYENKLFKIDPLTLEVIKTNLPVEYPESFSPDGNYYYSSSMFSRKFKIYNSKTGEEVSGKFHDIAGDTLYNVGSVLIKPKWLGNSGAILALDITPTKRYKVNNFSGPSHWIFDIRTEEVLFEDHSDNTSFDLGHYWQNSNRNYIVKNNNNDFQLLESKVVDKIKEATNNERGIE